MSNELTTPILDKLVGCVEAYLRGQTTLKQLEEWLLSNLQLILNSNDQKAIELANLLDADLVELGEGLLNESSLQKQLSKCLQKVINSLSIDHKEGTSPRETSSLVGSNTETVTVQKEDLGPVVDIHLDLPQLVA